jgi:uncharacterized metal-binding protein YceD (DUF177 family)
MIINKRDLLQNKSINLTSKTQVKDDDLKQIEGFIKLNKCVVEINVNYVEGMDLAICDITVKGDMEIKSTRTLKPVNLKFNESDTITYAFSENPDLEDDSIILVDNNEFDLHNEFVSLIVTSIPIKVVGEDEPEEFEGDTWEVISEDKYYQRKSKSSSPFDALKDLDLD